ncbi:MAG: AraC family transcriptional regulator [Bacteroidetes bacterium]|uniref:AraC family transcriptional regulator n=1 Tax=Candidatus Cryptobacteroides merdavium TaxID=2840769 RepID=A0A9D9EGL7_9BACT|nr:AraC family transcriptional regulator [Candidatus Cryptobacteroides merdavium]
MWRGGDSHNTEILPDTDRIRYVETDLAFLEGKPVHFICGIYLVCESGRCEVSTGAENFSLCAETELIFLAGTLLHRLEASDDFKARMILFPKDVFLKAMLPIDTPYLNYADEHPCYLHTSDERSRLTWRQACVWMDSAGMLFSGDYTSQYRELLEFDWLQSFLIWLFGTIPEKQESQSSSTRQQQICRSFMQLVREYAAQEHGAAFYAGKLCISTRYLHRATTLCLNGKSPKQIIEEQLLAEVKVLLDDPSLTVTAISERLNFPDQSYLTRFFKRHTGISPRRFRVSSRG